MDADAKSTALLGSLEHKSGRKKRFRNMVFTWNNYSEAEHAALVETWKLRFKYITFGREVGESGTPHLQGYAEAKKPTTFVVWRSYFGYKAYLAPRRGTPRQAADYCQKDGDYFEEGELSQQGRRTDLVKLKRRISEGKTTVAEIVMENPVGYHMYGRTLSKIEDLVLRKKKRTWMTKGVWYWGPTGVGKSHRAFTGVDWDDTYVWKDDTSNQWQDGYTGQSLVIINDFRGEIKYNQLLQMVDKWPYSVKRRGREPAPFLAKKVVITSSLPPDKVFKRRVEEDAIAQLNRRFEIIHMAFREGPFATE